MLVRKLHKAAPYGIGGKTMKTINIFLLISLCLLSSCFDDEINPLFGNFTGKDNCGWTGFNFVEDLNCFSRPCFNPNNPDEFVCIQEIFNDTNSNFNDSQTIVKFNLKTKEKTVLAKVSSFYSQIDWSSIGWIAYGDNGNIYIIKDDGSEKRKINPVFAHPACRFNEEGTKLIFRRRIDLSASDKQRNPGLLLLRRMYIIDLSGNIIDTLCIDGTKDYCGTFGIHDWRNTGFVSTYGKDGKTGIEFRNESGVLTSVIYDKRDDDKYPKDIEWNGKTDDVTYSVSNTGLMQIISGKIRVIRHYCDKVNYGYFSVSPDGEKIIAEKSLYTRINDCSAQEEKFLVIMDIDGRNEERIEIPE